MKGFWPVKNEKGAIDFSSLEGIYLKVAEGALALLAIVLAGLAGVLWWSFRRTIVKVGEIEKDYVSKTEFADFKKSIEQKNGESYDMLTEIHAVVTDKALNKFAEYIEQQKKKNGESP